MGKSILYIVCSFIVLPGLLPVQAMAATIRPGAIRVGIADSSEGSSVQVRSLAGVRVVLVGSSVLGMFAGLYARVESQPMILGVVPREDDQAFAVEIQVDEREAGAEPVMVFGLAALADLVEVEDKFKFPERMDHLDAHTRLTATLLLLLVIHPILISGSLAGHVLSLGLGCMDRLGLALVISAALHLVLLAI